MSMDIELAVLDAQSDDGIYLCDKLPNGYFVEDKSASGWGIVVRSRGGVQNDVEQLICEYLGGLSGFEGFFCAKKSILRVAVYNENATFTFRLGAFDVLQRFGTLLEVSVYPSMADD